MGFERPAVASEEERPQAPVGPHHDGNDDELGTGTVVGQRLRNIGFGEEFDGR